MFYSYTNLIHKHTAGFYNKISPQRSLSKHSTAYCISQYGTCQKKKNSMMARTSRSEAPSVTKLLNSRLRVCGEGGLTLRQQTHLYRGHLKYILLYLTTRLI